MHRALLTDPGMMKTIPPMCHRLALLAVILTAGTIHAFETVVIDPGHGGNDQGTEWRNISEKELTLSVSRLVEKILRQNNIQTVLTRHCDAYVSLDDRAGIANLIPQSLLLSIHFNGSRSPDINGFEIFAFRLSPASRMIAESIEQSMAENLRSRNRGVRIDQDYAVLVRCAGSAVLLECGFISNKAEIARLASPEGRQTLAEAISQAVMRIKPLINTDPPEADIAKCEIHARKHEDASKMAEAAAKKTDSRKKAQTPGKKPPSAMRKKSKG